MTVTDSEGCTGTDVFVITEPDELIVSTFPEDANCGAEDGAIVAILQEVLLLGYIVMEMVPIILEALSTWHLVIILCL